jgi:hypothetical protein
MIYKLANFEYQMPEIEKKITQAEELIRLIYTMK